VIGAEPATVWSLLCIAERVPQGRTERGGLVLAANAGPRVPSGGVTLKRRCTYRPSVIYLIVNKLFSLSLSLALSLSVINAIRAYALSFFRFCTPLAYDGYTAQRLTSPEMLALKARWTLAELSGVAGGDYKKGQRDPPAAGSHTCRVRGSLRRIGGSWLRVGARLRHINAEHMSLSLYSLIEVGGQRRWRSGVRANGLKVKFLCRMTNDTNFTAR
jgi:hypothetical protein